MRKELVQVAEFLDKFGIPRKYEPTFIEDRLFIKRCEHIREELNELAYTYGYIEANKLDLSKWTKVVDSKAPLEEVLDALIDIQYLVLGTALMHGFGLIFEEAFERVHKANMAKKLIHHISNKDNQMKFGVMKPEGWIMPDLKGLIDGNQ